MNQQIHSDATPAADPMHQVGEVFRRLCLFSELGEPALDLALHAVLAALGRTALDEAERRARTLHERTTPRSTDLKVTASRKLDADGWDPGDRE